MKRKRHTKTEDPFLRACEACGAAKGQPCNMVGNDSLPLATKATRLVHAARLKRIAASATKPRPPIAADPNDNAHERWLCDRIDEEAELAENRKHEGELPRPRSSFTITAPPRAGEFGDVEELNFGGDPE